MAKILAASTVRDRIREATSGMWSTSRGNYFGFNDSQYALPDVQAFTHILTKCQIQHFGNRGEVFDCDDYAHWLKGSIALLNVTEGIFESPIAFGVVWGLFDWMQNGQELHVANWVLTEDNNLLWVEPQYNHANSINSPIFRLEHCVGGIRFIMG